MHQRKLIRDAIVSLLLGKTDAESRVYPSRARPIESQSLPCIKVYANSEPVNIWQEAPREYERALSISIEILAKANESLDDALDAIAEQVEDILRQEHTLCELCRDVILRGTEITIEEGGETLIGSCNLTYETPYYSLAVADRIPANDYNDLDQVNIDWRGPGTPTGQFDAQDQIDLTD